MIVALKGIVKVTAKGHKYYYAWREGLRLRGEPGTPEFVASYNEAIANLRTPDTGRFHSLVTLYKDSDAFRGLAATTKNTWLPWLDRIADYFGVLRIANLTGLRKFVLSSSSGTNSTNERREQRTTRCKCCHAFVRSPSRNPSLRRTHARGSSASTA
jgi:hypothetical protein